MFSPDSFIETVQSFKKTVFNKLVQDEELQKVAARYVDTQTEFAKMLVHNAIDLTKYSMDKFYPSKEQASKAPYKVEKEAK